MRSVLVLQQFPSFLTVSPRIPFLNVFLADLLRVLTILSKILQYKFVDVTNIRLLVKAQIESICMLYLVDNPDLNEDTFHENFGHLHRLLYEIRRAKL